MFALLIAAAILTVAFASPIHPTPVKNTLENIALINSGQHKQKLTELSGQFEGDIILTTDQKRVIFTGQRSGLIDERYRWPNNIVSYVITNVFSEDQKVQIENALRTIEASTCIRFVERTIEPDYVEILGEDTGCWSYVGRIGQRQQLNLQRNGCLYPEIIMHEFLHALGFYHMQSSYDRDDYVRISWDHIEDGMANNFNMYDADWIGHYGFQYDVQSIMHYSAYAFTKDGFATIIPNDIKEINRIGYYEVLSELDVKKINAMYSCPM